MLKTQRTPQRSVPNVRSKKSPRKATDAGRALSIRWPALSSGCARSLPIFRSTQPKTNSLKSRRHSGTWAEGGVWPRATECRGFESEQKAHKASMPRLPGWDRSMRCRCGRPRVDSGAYERAAYRAKPRSDHPYSDFTDRSGPRTCHSCILIGASQGHRICPP